MLGLRDFWSGIVVCLCLVSTAAAQGRRMMVSGGGGDHYGTSIAPLADVNADGVPDIIIGAPQPVSGSPGFARVISGRDGSLLWQSSGRSDRSGFGLSVAGIGDVDGDGRQDVAVSGLNWRRLSADEHGYVRVCSGVDGRLLYEIPGNEEMDQFGHQVIAQGDVNDDRWGDFLVSAPALRDTYPGNLGRVRAFSGRDGALLYEVLACHQEDAFGQSVAAGGDLDGDGVLDFLVASPQAKNHSQGYVRAFSGSDGSILFELSGDEDAVAGFGESVAGGADLNGDGIPDILVVSRTDGRSRSDAVVTIDSLHAYSGADQSVLFTIPGESEGFLPSRVWFAGDVNGDGREEFILANPSSSGGTARLHDGRQPLAILAEYRAGQERERLGVSAATVGDINGDGVPDLALAAPWWRPASTTTGSAQGRVVLYSGIDNTVLLESNSQP